MDPCQTIPNSYKIVEVDGEPVLMERVQGKNGKLHWATVEGRLAQEREQQEFEERFNSTAFKPADAKPVTTDVLNKKSTDSPPAIDSKRIGKLIRTSQHTHAHLVMVLGQPADIIKNGKLFAPIKSIDVRWTTLKLIDALDTEEWNKVKPLVEENKY